MINLEILLKYAQAIGQVQFGRIFKHLKKCNPPCPMQAFTQQTISVFFVVGLNW